MSPYLLDKARFEAHPIGFFLDAHDYYSLADNVGQIVVPEYEIVLCDGGLFWSEQPGQRRQNITTATYGDILKRRRKYPARVVHLRGVCLQRFCTTIAEDPRLTRYGLENLAGGSGRVPSVSEIAQTRGAPTASTIIGYAAVTRAGETPKTRRYVFGARKDGEWFREKCQPRWEVRAQTYGEILWRRNREDVAMDELARERFHAVQEWEERCSKTQQAEVRSCR